MSRAKFTKEQELEIINYYQIGNSADTCAEKYNCVQQTVLNILQRHDIKARATNSVERELLICDLYLSGKTGKEIAQIIGISQPGIYRYLRKHNVLSRTNGETHKKYTIDENYFTQINTKDKAYFLGLLVSDGYGNSNGFQINLQVGDIDILKTFTNYISYNGPINIAKDNRKESYKDMARLIVCCQKIGNDLIQYGITKGKSYNAFFPDIPEEFHSHFIRGVFDGDGSIFVRKTLNSGGFSICGNNLLVEEIRKILINKCDIHIATCKQRNERSGFTIFAVTKKATILKIRDYLYNDCGDTFIKRKHSKMYSFI